jgi:ComF family protein
MQAPFCDLCGIGLSSESETCLSCRAYGTALPGIRLLRSAFLYAGNGPDVLHAYKAQGGRTLSGLWAQALVPRIREIWADGMAIVGIPSLRRNIRQRGFDQVSLIIEALPREFRLGSGACRLRRTGGKAQKTLTRQERQDNLAGRISISSSGGLPRRVLLLDDVCTTGATLSLCARILRSHGVEDVCAITVFRD